MGRWVANEKKYKQTDLTTFTLPSFFNEHYTLTRWFGLWCLTPLSTIFSYIVAFSFIGWRKPEYQEKIADLSQVT